MTTATVEVRPAVKRAVADHPGRAARTLRNAERAATCAPSDTERDRNRSLADEFRRAMAAATRCRRCGKELTDPESIEAGIGRDCAAKAGS